MRCASCLPLADAGVEDVANVTGVGGGGDDALTHTTSAPRTSSVAVAVAGTTITENSAACATVRARAVEGEERPRARSREAVTLY